MTTRRRFLKSSIATTGLLSLPVASLFSAGGCSGVPISLAPVRGEDRVTLGLFPSSSLQTPEDAIHQVLEGMDLSWLRAGDSVFVKVACNSGNRHPAVTSPVAVRAMCQALFDRGAGRVVVGDQSGVMSVRLAKNSDGQDVRYRSTRGLMAGNGLLDAIDDSGAEAHFFDDQGFDDGYVQASIPEFPDGSPWRRRPFIARIATEVDHIVYLPRLSSHLLTGYTHGHKLAVGWLRDDARHEMHHDASTIYEKFTDVNYCDEIRSRLRLTVTYAEEILLDGGPDGGAIATADPRVVLASSHLANHDTVAVAVLTWAQNNLSSHRNTGGLPWGPWASMVNTAFLAAVEPQTRIPWTSSSWGIPGGYGSHAFHDGVTGDRALLRAYELHGGLPSAIRLALVGDAPAETLRAHLLERTAVAFT
jgi:uncharacterized protein (DUF362 family)